MKPLQLLLLAMALSISSNPGLSEEEAAVRSCTEGPVVCWKIYAPVRTLRWELALPASIQEVWAAWTDPVEITKWAAPGAAVELEPSGTWEVHFYPNRPPGQRGSDANEILSVVPGRELVIAAGAPPEYPTVRATKTVFKVQLESVGDGHTLVRVEQSGWRTGDEWERAFEDLAAKNRVWLSWLHRRFVEGPIDWDALGSAQAESEGKRGDRSDRPRPPRSTSASKP